jgi:hypothetical protein
MINIGPGSDVKLKESFGEEVDLFSIDEPA